MKRIFFVLAIAVAVACAAGPAHAVLEACKTTVGDSWFRLKCDQVCESVATCVADGKKVCNGTCSGGPNNGNACDSDAQCPDVSNVCVGGPNDGNACTHSNQCPDEIVKICGGGPSNPNYGLTCEDDDDCEFRHFTCRNGPFDDQPCEDSGDCDGYTCREDPDSTPNCETIVVEDGRCGVNAECAPRTTGDPVLCAVDVDHVKGSGGNDRIFVGDGDVKVEGRGGDDQILKGSNNPIRYMNGAALNPLNTGRLLADGGSGNDTIGNASTADGDILFGDTGNDVLVGCGGRNVLHGGEGNDTLNGWAFCNIDDSPLGNLLCGGPGDDTLNGWGTGHQCMDAGEDQTTRPSGVYDCSYIQFATGNPPADASDLPTQANCASPDAATGAAPVAPCGCDAKFSDVLFPLE